MTTLEAIVLGAIGSLAAWKALRHLAPALVAGLQTRIAVQLTRPGLPSSLQRYGNGLRPAVSKPTTGCGSGCSACSGCAMAASNDAVQPPTFRRIEPPPPRN